MSMKSGRTGSYGCLFCNLHGIVESHFISNVVLQLVVTAVSRAVQTRGQVRHLVQEREVVYVLETYEVSELRATDVCLCVAQGKWKT